MLCSKYPYNKAVGGKENEREEKITLPKAWQKMNTAMERQRGRDCTGSGQNSGLSQSVGKGEGKCHRQSRRRRVGHFVGKMREKCTSKKRQRELWESISYGHNLSELSDYITSYD